MSKRLLCIGRVRNGGPVEIRPTLEESLDAQISRNAEALAMLADLDAMLNGKPPAYKLTDADLQAMDDEKIGAEIGRSPWQW